MRKSVEYMSGGIYPRFDDIHSTPNVFSATHLATNNEVRNSLCTFGTQKHKGTKKGQHGSASEHWKALSVV